MKDIFKRVVVIVLAVLMIFSLLLVTASSVFAQNNTAVIEAVPQTTEDGFEYTIEENATVTITKYTGEADELTVPETIADLPVVKIAERAFEAKTTLTEVTLPDSIVSIGAAAFEGCSSLMVVNIGAQTKSVDADVFSDCIKLTAVFVSENNPHLSNENGVLFNKNKTELIYYPIGNSRESYELPGSVTTIRAAAFAGCDILKTVTLQGALTTIEDRAFLGCEAIESLTLPQSLESIGAYAFASLKSLGSIEIPKKITQIPEAMLSECAALKSVKLPSTLKKVGANAFAFCAQLEEIVFLEGLEEICEDAFLKCTSLKSLTFPKSLKKIPQNALSSCEQIATIKYAGSESEWLGLNVDSGNAMIVYNYIYEKSEDDESVKPPQSEDTASKPSTPDKNPEDSTSSTTQNDNTQNGTSSEQKPSDSIRPQESTQNNSSNSFVAAGERVSFFESDKLTISGDKNALPEKTQVSAEQIYEGLDFVKVKAAVKDYVTRFEVYKLSFVLDDKNVSPADALTLKFKIPADYDIKKAQILFVSDRGGASELDSVVNKKDGTISTEIINGGTYVLAEMTHVTQPMSFGTVTLILAAIALVAVTAAYVIKKAKQKNKE